GLIPTVFNFEGGVGCGHEGQAQEQGQDHGRASSFFEIQRKSVLESSHGATFGLWQVLKTGEPR
ncbi:MAG: hypothetical protein ACPG1Z_08120, partial [Planctomycetota bacterium]